MEDRFSVERGVGGWFWDDSSPLHLLCTLFLLSLHQLHLRPSGRLGIPCVEDISGGVQSFIFVKCLVDNDIFFRSKQIEGEKLEAVTIFLFLGSKITVDDFVYDFYYRV